MSWTRLTVIRILLLVAWMIEEDQSVKAEIVRLTTHISVHAPKEVK